MFRIQSFSSIVGKNVMALDNLAKDDVDETHSQRLE